MRSTETYAHGKIGSNSFSSGNSYCFLSSVSECAFNCGELSPCLWQSGAFEPQVRDWQPIALATSLRTIR